MKKLLFIACMCVVVFLGCEKDVGDWVRPYDYQFSITNNSDTAVVVLFEGGNVSVSAEIDPSSVWVVGSNDSVAVIKVGGEDPRVYNCNKMSGVVIK